MKKPCRKCAAKAGPRPHFKKLKTLKTTLKTAIACKKFF